MGGGQEEEGEPERFLSRRLSRQRKLRLECGIPPDSKRRRRLWAKLPWRRHPHAKSPLLENKQMPKKPKQSNYLFANDDLLQKRNLIFVLFVCLLYILFIPTRCFI